MPDESAPSEFMTVAEVAELLKLNQQTIRNYVDAGRLAAIRIDDRRVRIRREDVDRFIDGQTTKPTSQSRADRIRALEEQVADLNARVEGLEARPE